MRTVLMAKGVGLRDVQMAVWGNMIADRRIIDNFRIQRFLPPLSEEDAIIRSPEVLAESDQAFDIDFPEVFDRLDTKGGHGPR